MLFVPEIHCEGLRIHDSNGSRETPEDKGATALQSAFNRVEPSSVPRDDLVAILATDCEPIDLDLENKVSAWPGCSGCDAGLTLDLRDAMTEESVFEGSHAEDVAFGANFINDAYGLFHNCYNVNELLQTHWLNFPMECPIFTPEFPETGISSADVEAYTEELPAEDEHSIDQLRKQEEYLSWVEEFLST